MNIIYQILGWIFMAYIWALYALLGGLVLSGAGWMIQAIVIGIKNHIANMKRLEYLEDKESKNINK